MNPWLEELRQLRCRKEKPGEEKATRLDVESFDPDGYSEKLLSWARQNGKGDNELARLIDDIVKDGTLKAPWGIKIKNSPILGDYWVVSDDQAKKLIPKDETAFTQEDIRLLAEIREIFGTRVVEVKKR